MHHPTGVPNLNGLWSLWLWVLFKWNNSSTSDLWWAHITAADGLVLFTSWLTEGATGRHLCWCRPTQQIYSVWDPPTKHSISVLEELHQQTHTPTQKKCTTVLISIRWHLLATNMREEQSAPLANLSAVNYGNLPSCLSAFAAGLPFVSKSKAGICKIGTFPFLQGHALHKRLMTGDIYSTLSLWLPLQTACTHKHTRTHRYPRHRLGGEAKSFWNSSTGVHFCLSSDFTWFLCVYSECLWVCTVSTQYVCAAARTSRQQQKPAYKWKRISQDFTNISKLYHMIFLR